MAVNETLHLGRVGRSTVYESTSHRSPGVWQRVKAVRVSRAAADAARDALGIALLSCAGATISATVGLIVAGVGCLMWRVRA